MNIFEQYETNENTEANGTWIPYDEETAFKLSRMCNRNKKYRVALERATRPHKNAIRLGTLSEKIDREVYIGVFVDTILLGWKGVKDRDEKEIKFTKENAVKVLNALPDLYHELLAHANDADLFRQNEIEGESKN